MTASSLSRVSDAELVACLTQWVQSGRRVTAEILMHLAEIEDRRLHLKAGHNSLFSYCLAVHGMSEDEACRRIEVARLGRRFSSIFGLLASGDLSLSVAALLKDCLTDDNHASVLAAVSGKSVRAAREELAAIFPMPDAPSTISKLPNLRPNPVPNSTRDIAGTTPAPVWSRERLVALDERRNETDDHSGAQDLGAQGRTVAGQAATTPTPAGVAPMAETNAGNVVNSAVPRAFSATPAPSQANRARVEPTAAGRYRVQFTATLEQKRKLELALDLMSHQNPSRDLAATVERGLDLLIEELLRARMGKTNRPNPARKSTRGRVTNATRRAVVERDGLRCAFVDERGQRCEARAFLEFDHVQPLGKGAGSELGNVRLLCGRTIGIARRWSTADRRLSARSSVVGGACPLEQRLISFASDESPSTAPRPATSLHRFAS